MQTDDLFLGALGLVRGGELEEIEVRGSNGRRICFFRISGQGMSAAERDYHRGETRVDLRLLKTEVRRLKDAAFAAMRSEERRRDARHERGDRTYPGGEPSRRGRR
jgi:hypothetical protein